MLPNDGGLPIDSNAKPVQVANSTQNFDASGSVKHSPVAVVIFSTAVVTLTPPGATNSNQGAVPRGMELRIRPHSQNLRISQTKSDLTTDYEVIAAGVKECFPCGANSVFYIAGDSAGDTVSFGFHMI